MELQKRSIQVEIAELITQGKVLTVDDIVSRYNVTYVQAVNLFSNQKFIQLVSLFSKAKTQMAWYGEAIPRLMEMIKSRNDKVAIQAIKMLGQITDSIQGGDFNININLEGMVKQFEENSNSLNPDLEDVVHEAEFSRMSQD